MVRDPRVTPARPDLAAASLRGEVTADRFVEPRRMRVASFATAVRRAPRGDAPLDTEALAGEAIDVYEVDDEGWAWGQLASDGYVGYLAVDDLIAASQDEGAAANAAMFRVSAPRTFIYPTANIKAPPLGALPLNGWAPVSSTVQAKDAAAGAAAARFQQLASGGFVYARHLAAPGVWAEDAATVAGQFVGAPYLWGGRTALGLDCSALVQLALMATGGACPRDSDMQAAQVGVELAPDVAQSSLQRGDLVFWRGHVGMMLDGLRLIHANGHHMQVAVEPLAEAVARIARDGGGDIIALRRP